jgi:putative peptide zinc metalloprotease protein
LRCLRKLTPFVEVLPLDQGIKRKIPIAKPMARANPPQVQIKTQPAAESVRLPRLREDLKLMGGPAHRDGSPSWRIQDPIRNSFFEIGWLEFELLARWHEHKTLDTLREHVMRETQLRPSREEIEELVLFLTQNQLLRPDGGAVSMELEGKLHAAKLSWYEYVFHHYLFFRVPLFHPDRFLGRTVGITDLFFNRGFAALIAVLLCVDLYLVGREWHSFAEAFQHMLTPQGLVYTAIALSLAKVIHEFGHAYAAKRYGVRVPAMGVAFMIMVPYLYTDTGETWKLVDRRKQMIIALAGMGAELALAVIATLLWAISPEGVVKSVLFVLATSTWLMTLAINASPFMRFDGYFVLSDYLDFPNLHERGTLCARWWLRTTIFGLQEQMPEPSLSLSARRWLIAFAFVTWIYRLVVFFGIALLVYYMFFKLLGIFLMLLEIAWFIVRPIWKETAYLLKQRSRIKVAWRPVLITMLVVTIGLWMVPVTNQVTAPGILRGSHEQAVFAPFGARVVSVSVAPMQKVSAGTLLIDLDAQDLKVRGQKAEVSIASARAELSRTPASLRQQERSGVLASELAEALASRQAVFEESASEQLRASQAGTVRDVSRDLVPGRYVNPRQQLMKIVSESEPLLEIFVSERQIGAVRPGQDVHFYPSVPNHPVVRGTLVAVDKSPLKELPQPLLASVFGGDIAISTTAKNRLTAQDAVFRVLVKPEASTPAATMVIRGTARIETDFRFVAENFIYRALSVLIRESGL